MDIIFPGNTLPTRPEHDPRESHKVRRRYRGKTVSPTGVPRSHSGGSGNGGRAPYYSMSPRQEKAPDQGGQWLPEVRVGLAVGVTRHRGVGYQGWT